MRAPWTFQSAPRSFDRGVLRSKSRTGTCACFNPHPGPSTGVSPARPRAPGGQAVSIRTPGPSTGVSSAVMGVVPSQPVSIRTPVLRPGCHARSGRSRWYRTCFNPHPGPSTGVSWTRPAMAVAWKSFNPHPGPSTGVSWRAPSANPRPPCFNPHPGPSTGVSSWRRCR